MSLKNKSMKRDSSSTRWRNSRLKRNSDLNKIETSIPMSLNLYI